ncbi:MAG: hypothetical protein R3B82_30095 [Sandaracinaceae bacterium]
MPLRIRSIAVFAALFAVACAGEDGGGDAATLADAALADAAPAVDGGADAGGSEDAGGIDAGATDAGVPDAGRPDAGPPDPATCPIGDADGCCPLLRTGGSDPDCASLDCDAFRAGEPILLDDFVGGWRSDETKGGTGIAWTGTELVLARTDWDEDGMTRSIELERRDATGALVFGPVRIAHRTSTGIRSLPGEAALAWEPTSQTLGYVDALSQSYDLVGLSPDGEERFTVGAGAAFCNWNTGWVDTVAADGRFLVMGHQYTCAGSTDQPHLSEVQVDGTRTFAQGYGDGMRSRNAWESHAACELGCGQIGFFWNRSYENDLRHRRVDPTMPTAGMGETVGVGYFMTGVHDLAVASDGVRYLFVDWPGSLSVGTVSMRAGVYAPGAGWATPITRVSGVPAEVPAMARAIWTGDGYLVSAVTWSRSTGETSTPLSEPSRFHVQLFHFAPDGALRATWRNEDDANLFPQMAWAGGRVAMTWTRIPPRGSAEEPRRYLRYLDCP